MLTIKRRTINERDLDYFLNDPHTNIVIEEAGISEKETSDLLHNIAEKADWIINSILSEQILQIDNKQIRNRFRRFLISEKYNILMDYRTEKYCIIYADDNCILVQSPHVIRGNEMIKPTSTIVLFSTGEVKVPEGVVWLNERPTAHGFTAKWNNLFGLYTNNGDVFLPCIFEEITTKEYERYHYLRYKGFYYMFIPTLLKQEELTSSHEVAYSFKDRTYCLRLMHSVPSFLRESGKYRLDEESFAALAEKNKEELCGILDNCLCRIENDKIGETH